MRLTAGERVREIQLPAIDGSFFRTTSLQGTPFMLSFFRFASCPFCNMRINELVRRYDELGRDFSIVAIFDSPLDNLTRHASGHKAPFPVLADERNMSYRDYGVERSVAGVIKGMVVRMPTLLRGMARGYIPLIPRGSLLTMPADFLIDHEGIIREAYYGADEGDHLPFDRVKQFSLQHMAG